MNEEQQLKLQAFLDGELPEAESREVAAWLAKDAGATALAAELRNTRRAIKDAQPAARVPESREFYWSKIEREIERLTPAAAPAPRTSVLTLLRRALAPAGALALLLAVGVLTLRHSAMQPAPDTEMAMVKSDLFTYQDFANGTTLVWVSFPEER